MRNIILVISLLFYIIECSAQFDKQKGFINSLWNDSTIKIKEITSHNIRALHAYPNLGFGKYRIVVNELMGGDSYFVFPCLDLFVYDYLSKNKKEEWRLSLVTQRYAPSSILKGARFLIKLNDGNIIQLKADDDKRDAIGRLIDNRITYMIDPMFIITKSQIDSIVNQGVNKIRVEYLSGIGECEFKKETLGNFISRAKEMIDSVLYEKKDPMLYGF